MSVKSTAWSPLVVPAMDVEIRTEALSSAEPGLSIRFTSRSGRPAKLAYSGDPTDRPGPTAETVTASGLDEFVIVTPPEPRVTAAATSIDLVPPGDAVRVNGSS